MKRSIFLCSVAVALLLGPVLSSAQPQDAPQNRPNPGRQGDRPLMRGGDELGPTRQSPMERRRVAIASLGLSEVQQADIRKAREATRRDRLRKSTDLKIASLDLRSLLRSEKVDEKAVAAKLVEVQAAQGALLKLRVDAALAMKRILTPEQQKKLTAMRADRGLGRMRQRMNRRGPNGFDAPDLEDEDDDDPDPDPDPADIRLR